MLHPETLQDFELAAEQKYWEGIELSLAGRRGAGIYLMGYAAEMILKNSCFCLDGANPADQVVARLAPARRWMTVQCPLVRDESYHSLWFWTWLLRAKRRNQGRPLSDAVDWGLVRRMRRLYQLWWVEMRYRPDQAQLVELELVYDDVTWLREHQLSLWR
jgi:hypothetical protein